MRRFIRLLAVMLALTAGLVAAPAMGQTVIQRLVTPGPLSAAHAKLEKTCSTCHENFRKDAQDGKCIDCHTGIGRDKRTGTGFHGKFADARKGTCKSCHSEHKGRANDLTRFNTATFNHDLTDYQLRGAHAKIKCAQCHTPGRPYRVAPVTCVGCHKTDDPHKGQLGTRCQTCHVVDGWKSIKPFDHSGKTGFALTGAHAKQGCMTCHAGQKWKGLGQTCIACHAKDDAHKGSRGTNCASCHTTQSWTSTTFDHDSTGFSLIGAHAATSCAGCHGVNMAVKKPSRTCYGCHAKDDSHKGANGTDCASCHNPQSWKRVSFDHDRLTEFPLRGAHRQVACEGCHIQPPKQVKPANTCYGCHAEDDSHKGGNGTDCARCHNEVDWKKADFDHAKSTNFPLLGKHGQIKCEDCHVEPADRIQLIPQCAACHLEDDAHKTVLGADCGRCHDSNDWTTNVRFDHDLTPFPLLGKHAQVECIECHVDKTFSVKGKDCAACHADDHHKGTLGTPSSCGTCHTTNDWKVWKFDHDRQTDFPLTGKHKGLICSSCHARPGNPAEMNSTCADCHRRDDIHRGGFGVDCQRCHTTEDFRDIRTPTR